MRPRGSLIVGAMLAVGLLAPFVATAEEEPFVVTLKAGRTSVLQAESLAFWVELECRAPRPIEAIGALLVDEEYPRIQIRRNSAEWDTYRRAPETGRFRYRRWQPGEKRQGWVVLDYMLAPRLLAEPGAYEFRVIHPHIGVRYPGEEPRSVEILSNSVPVTVTEATAEDALALALYVGDGSTELNPYKTAVQERLREVHRKYPATPYGRLAAYELAMVLESKAASMTNRLERSAVLEEQAAMLEGAIGPGMSPPLKERALRRLVEHYIVTKEPAKALQYARQLLRQFPDTRGAEQLRQMLPKLEAQAAGE